MPAHRFAGMKEKIPSPTPEVKPYQREALHEIWTSVGAIIGLAIQVAVFCTEKLGPGVAAQLAAAMYGPDSDTKLIALSKVRGSVQPFQWIGWTITAVSLATLFYLRYRRAIDRDKSELQMKSPEGLSGCAHVLHAFIKFGLQIPAGDDDGEVRVTVHRITTEPGKEPEIEQAIHYVGSKVPSGQGRRFPIGAGVIGLVARSGEPKVAYRTSTTDDEYRAELVSQWGYTQETAEKMNLDRKSFIGIPIKGPDNEVIGVVYVDSCRENAFEKGMDEAIIATATGIAAYIQERFI